MPSERPTDAERVHFTPAAAHAAMCEIIGRIGRIGYSPREQEAPLSSGLCGMPTACAAWVKRS